MWALPIVGGVLGSYRKHLHSLPPLNSTTHENRPAADVNVAIPPSDHQRPPADHAIDGPGRDAEQSGGLKAAIRNVSLDLAAGDGAVH